MVEAEGVPAGQGCARGDGACGVGGAITAVGGEGDEGDVAQARELGGCGQGELLVAPAAAGAPQGDGCLAARDDAGRARCWPAARSDLPQHGGKEAPRLAGLALEGGGEEQRREALGLGGREGSLGGELVAADEQVLHTREERVVGLGRLGEGAGGALA
jgi:hypothetical protein